MRFVDNPETAVLAAAKDMLRRGLVEGTAGNISARREDGNLVITSSSVDYADMALDDLVLVDPDGAVLQAKEGRSPSSEMQLHLSCYHAFDDAFATLPHLVCYAMKANPNLAIVDLFARLGSGFDIVSGGELARVLAAGGDPRKVPFGMSKLS